MTDDDRFDRAMEHLAVHEGGYSNHPDDPGGATMKGVTQRVYDAYRRRKGRAVTSVRAISDTEVYEIYRSQYWDTVRADDLPPGLAYCVFDAAVNSGPARAARWLQGLVGVARDGVVGEMTLSAVYRHGDIEHLIDAYCDKRLAFMERLKHWPTFKNGWTARVEDVRLNAVRWAMMGSAPPIMHSPDPAEDLPTAKAEGPERTTVWLKDMVLNWKGVSATLGSFGAVLSAGGGNGPVAWALAGVLLIGALAGVYLLLSNAAAEAAA